MRLPHYLLIIAVAGVLITNSSMKKHLAAVEDWQIPSWIFMSGDAIIAFEFASDATTVNQIFTTDQERKVTALCAHTRADYGFILSYVLFFLCATWLLFDKRKAHFKILVASAFIAGIFDVVENVHLGKIMDHLGNDARVDQLVGFVQPFVWVKWILAASLFISIVAGSIKWGIGKFRRSA